MKMLSQNAKQLKQKVQFVKRRTGSSLPGEKGDEKKGNSMT